MSLARPSLHLASAQVGWSRAEIVRRVAWKAMGGAALLGALAIAVAIPLDRMGLAAAGLVALVGAVVAAFVLALARFLGVSWRAGRVDIDGSRLAVTTSRGVRHHPLDDVAAGWIEGTREVRLRMRDGLVLAIDARDPPEAEAVLRAAGVGARQRVLALPLSSPASMTAGGTTLAVLGVLLVSPTVLLFMGVIGLGLHELLTEPSGTGVGALVLCLVLLGVFGGMLGAIVDTLRPREVVVGVDGLSVKSLWSRRFVGYGEVAKIEADPRGVRLTARSGALLLPTWRRGEPPLPTDGAEASSDGARRQRVLLERLREAAGVERNISPDLGALDRRGRSLAIWREEVRKLVHAPSDYRRTGLEPSHLGDVVEDAAAPPERRIAAAMALVGVDDAAARRRVRVAIDTCADEDLRVALEQAAEDELDEEVVRRVVRRR